MATMALFTKKWIFSFLVSCSITFVTGFFIWNIFASPGNGVFNQVLSQINEIGYKIFPASISPSSQVENVIPTANLEQNVPSELTLEITDTESQNPAIAQEESLQDQLDDIQEKLDIIRQQVQELVAEQNPDIQLVKAEKDKTLDDQNKQNQADEQNDNQNTNNTNENNNNEAVVCTGQININTASAEDLDKITQVGLVTAQKIIAARPFYSFNDLLKVSGIGEKILKEIIEQGCAYVEFAPGGGVGGVGGGGGGGGSAPIVYPKILISEVQISPIAQRFVELYNPNSTDVGLTGWYLQRKTATGSDYSSFVTKNDFSGKTIRANNYFLISRSDIAADITLADLTLTPNNFLALKSPDEKISDEIGFNSADDNKSLGRIWDETSQSYSDTDNDQADFELDASTPKSQNIAYVEPPAPADTTPPQVSFDIASTQTTFDFPINFTITDPIIGTTTPSGAASYVFQWQAQGDANWQQDTPIMATTSSSTLSATRDFTGEDGKTYNFQVQATDAAGNVSDWLPVIPAATSVAIPVVQKAILINEIQINPIAQRFVELYNPNSTDVGLTGWYLQRKDSNDTSWGSFVSSTNFEGKIIPAGGYFLISRELANSDILFDITLSDNNSLALKNPSRDIVDKVGWGQASDPESVSALSPPDGESITRTSGIDTDDNSQDFIIIDTPTPKG